MTIPNLISALRLAMVPLVLWLLLGRDDPAAAGLVLGGLGATDWVDGYLARRLGQVSELGKFLDPLADRLAVAAGVIGGWISGALPWPIAAAIVVRESLVAVGALLLAVRAGAKLEVRYLGKVATLGLYLAVPSFLIHDGTGSAFFEITAWVFVIPGLVLYYVVAALYAMDTRRLLRRNGTVSSPEHSVGGQG